MSFKRYIKAVGTGIKGNTDLTKEECFEAITHILNQDITNEEIGAFLIGLRVKLESDEELLGALEACKNMITSQKYEESFELGYSMDGKNKSPYLFPLYGKILDEVYEKNKEIKPFKLVISVDDLQPATKGVTTKDICKNLELGDNILVYDRFDYINKLHNLTTIRNNIGLRTVFNTVEKLLNPANSRYALTSAFHKPYVKKYSFLFGSSYEKFVVVKGKEGAPEFFNKCQFWQIENGEIKDYSYDLSDFGINEFSDFENLDKDTMINLLKNPDDNLIKIAKFNIAFLLFISGRFNTLEEAVQKVL